VSRGFTVALIGCDGAGKTTVARRLEDERDLPIRYLYMGVSSDSSNRQLPTTRLVHLVKRRRGAPPDTRGPRESNVEPPRPKGLVPRIRKSVRASLRLTNRLAEEWYRQALATAQLLRGRIVVFDRHFTADYYAADIASRPSTISRRLHGFLLTKVYPQPDVVVFLDAPAEVLFERKGEGTIASLSRRRDEYHALGRTLPNFSVVSATQPLEQVVRQVAEIVRGYRGRA
jgi:thymidylate kinase